MADLQNGNSITEEGIPVQETLSVGLLLAMTGGFLDVYTYLLRGGVFANAQTGNMVLLSIAAAQKDFVRAAYYLIPIAAFFMGVLITEYIKKHFTDRQQTLWMHIVLIIEIFLLFPIGFLPRDIPDAVVNVTVSFICSMQVNSFRKTHGLPYATTMCTGNLRSAAEYFFIFAASKDKNAGKQSAHYFLIILAFLFGAAAGTFLCGVWDGKAIWACGLFLFPVLWIMRPNRKGKKLFSRYKRNN